jgi:hypothetical protein
MKTNENYQVHILTVNDAEEKKLFQIKLPRNAKKITGILTSATSVNPSVSSTSVLIKDGKPYFSLKAGRISLKLHSPKNIFFSDDVMASEIMPNCEALMGIKKIGFDSGNFCTQGQTMEYRNVNIESKETIIDGYYADTMLVNELIPYQVKIYIRYETEQ